MGDVALTWAAGAGNADLAISEDDVSADDGLWTAVMLSLFTDRLAEGDDALPAEDGDRRGWWADEFAEVEGDRFGSRLWLLDRSTGRADVVRRAEEIAREALQWMIDDHVAEGVDVAVELAGSMLAIAVTVHRPAADPLAFLFQHAWSAHA